MGVNGWVLPHLEVFTGGAQHHLFQDEAPDEGVEDEVGKSHDPREYAGHKEAWKSHDEDDGSIKVSSTISTVMKSEQVWRLVWGKALPCH